LLLFEKVDSVKQDFFNFGSIVCFSENGFRMLFKFSLIFSIYLIFALMLELSCFRVGELNLDAFCFLLE